MNAVLRIFVWLLALSVVALPVVAVVNGWVGAERWPLAKLRVHGEFKRVPAEQLQQVLLPYARAGFFAVKLQWVTSVSTVFEGMPLSERLAAVVLPVAAAWDRIAAR